MPELVLIKAAARRHLLHSLDANGVKRWVSLSEGQHGGLGWLTVRFELHHIFMHAIFHFAFNVD